MTKTLLVCFVLALGTVQAQNPFTSSITPRFNSIRMNLEEAADVMPADKFSFKLTDGQMSFGEWIIHSANSNYGSCSTIRGQERPVPGAKLNALKEKGEVAQALKDSFTYCAEAIQGLDDAKALASQQVANAVLQTIVHNNEIYGNIVGYLRVSGIVPPSTARAQKAKKKK
jgi:hypothetical protein